MNNSKTQDSLADLGDWLVGECTRIIDGCKTTAFNGITLYTPDATAFYKALWVRDFFYIVDGVPEMVPEKDVRQCCDFLLYGQREDGMIPDRRFANGVPVYSAGYFEEPLGEPPTDNAQFMVKLVHAYVTHSGDTAYFTANKDRLECALHAVCRRQSLVYIPPGTKQSPYGFTDQIGKTGHLLFSSILFVEACACMAELYAKTGDDERRRGWDDERIRVTDAIEMLWSDEEDMYFAADKDCRQYDVWGSAYMAYTGICSRQKTLRIGQRLVRDYDRIIQNGQVRHLFYPEYWNNKIGVRHQVTNLPKEGTYQNGAYWGIASGWVAGAMDLVADGSGRRLLGELVRYYQHAGIFEAVNTETGYFGAKDYCSSVTLVIKELRRMGLDI